MKYACGSAHFSQSWASFFHSVPLQLRTRIYTWISTSASATSLTRLRSQNCILQPYSGFPNTMIKLMLQPVLGSSQHGAEKVELCRQHQQKSSYLAGDALQISNRQLCKIVVINLKATFLEVLHAPQGQTRTQYCSGPALPRQHLAELLIKCTNYFVQIFFDARGRLISFDVLGGVLQTVQRIFFVMTLL